MAVELVCEGLEEAVSTWEPVSGVFLYANRRPARELKALRLRADQSSADPYSDMFAFVIMLWFVGVQDLKLHIFSTFIVLMS